MSSNALASGSPAIPADGSQSLTIGRGTALYALSLIVISGGYYVYWWAWKLKAYYLGWLVCLAIALVPWAMGRLRLTGLARDLTPVIVWFCYLFASALWAPSPADTLYYTAIGLLSIVAYIAGYTWFRSASVRALVWYFELQTLLIVPLMLYFLLTVGQLYDSSLGAVRTGFAATCLTAIPFLIWRVRHQPNLITGAMIAMALTFVLTGESRSSLLVAPVLVIGALTFAGRAHNRVKSLALFGVLALVGGGLTMVIPSAREAVGRSYAAFSGRTSLNVSSAIVDELAASATTPAIDVDRRLQLFVSLRSFAQNPFLGAGYESTYSIIREEFGREVSAHGLPSMLLGETGIAGTLIFGWMIAAFYSRVRRAKKNARGEYREFLATCQLGMLGILLLGLFHQVDQNPSLYLLLAWGSASARGNPVNVPGHP